MAIAGIIVLIIILFVSKDSEVVLCQKFQQTLTEQLGEMSFWGTIFVTNNNETIHDGQRHQLY